jgi:hypothetical protein
MAKNGNNPHLMSSLANSFSHDSISNRFLIYDRDPQNIKVIDNYTSES